MDSTKQSQYQLELLTLPVGNFHYHYDLDAGFFAEVGSTDIERGSIAADVEVSKTNSVIEVRIVMTGNVEVTCDRCLGKMEMPVDVDETVYVKFGTEYSDEGGDTITVSEEDGIFDISWLMYEYVVLSLPAVRKHDDGECDEEMMAMIESLQPGHKETHEEKDEVDPRWVALKKILNN